MYISCLESVLQTAGDGVIVWEDSWNILGFLAPAENHLNATAYPHYCDTVWGLFAVLVVLCFAWVSCSMQGVAGHLAIVLQSFWASHSILFLTTSAPLWPLCLRSKFFITKYLTPILMNRNSNLSYMDSWKFESDSLNLAQNKRNFKGGL